MTAPAEEWRQVPGYTGRYEVSDLGNVRTVSQKWINSTNGQRKGIA